MLCNLASHTELDLQELSLWPPFLDLEASGIVPNVNPERSRRAWNLINDGDFIDEDDALSLKPDVQITQEMLWVSQDSTTFDLVRFTMDLS